MKINKENLMSYLITLQLLKADYHLTFDELQEQYEASFYLNKKLFFQQFTMTTKQNKEWFVEATPIVQKVLNINKNRAYEQLMWLDLQVGLMLKG